MFDWKLGIFILNFIILIINAIIFIMIKFNDLKHLTASVIEIKQKIDKIFTRLGKIEKEQYARKIICEERHADKKLP